MSYHCTPPLTKPDKSKCYWGCGAIDLFYTASRSINLCNSVENNLALASKVEHAHPCYPVIPFLSVNPMKNLTSM